MSERPRLAKPSLQPGKPCSLKPDHLGDAELPRRLVDVVGGIGGKALVMLAAEQLVERACPRACPRCPRAPCRAPNRRSRRCRPRRTTTHGRAFSPRPRRCVISPAPRSRGRSLRRSGSWSPGRPRATWRCLRPSRRRRRRSRPAPARYGASGRSRSCPRSGSRGCGSRRCACGQSSPAVARCPGSHLVPR